MIRAVLDTNVVLSALLFTSGRLAWIRRAWQHRKLHPLVCKETVSELLRVIAYPKFKLDIAEQQGLLEDVLPYVDVIELPEPWPLLPMCRDEKDQMFLVLAHVGHAEVLLSGGRDILAMRDAFPGLIVTPDEWAERQDVSGRAQ